MTRLAPAPSSPRWHHVLVSFGGKNGSEAMSLFVDGALDNRPKDRVCRIVASAISLMFFYHFSPLLSITVSKSPPWSQGVRIYGFVSKHPYPLFFSAAFPPNMPFLITTLDGGSKIYRRVDTAPFFIGFIDDVIPTFLFPHRFPCVSHALLFFLPLSNIGKKKK